MKNIGKNYNTLKRKKYFKNSINKINEDSNKTYFEKRRKNTLTICYAFYLVFSSYKFVQ